MTDVPLQGTPGVWDFRNPTLIPNFDKVVANGDTMDQESPGVFIAANPRVSALANGLVGGSITNGDTVSLTVTLGTLPTGSTVVTYKAVTSDTTITVAEGLISAINNNSTLHAAGIQATPGGTSNASQFVVRAPGQIGNFATLGASVSGGNTETIVFGTGTVAVGNATGTAIVTGSTLTSGDTVAITLTNAGVTGLPITNKFTLSGTETTSSIALGLKNLINANTILAAASITAVTSTNTLTISEPGTIGNTTVMTKAITGTGDEAVTLSNSGTLTGGTGTPSAVLSGGSGPVVAANNFTFAGPSGQVQDFMYGQPYQPGYDLLTLMVNQGMPII